MQQETFNRAFDRERIIRQLASSGAGRDLAVELYAFKSGLEYKQLGFASWRLWLAQCAELPQYDQVQRLVRVGALIMLLKDAGVASPPLAISTLDAIKKPIEDCLKRGNIEGAQQWLNKAQSLGPRDLQHELLAAGYLKRANRLNKYLTIGNIEGMRILEASEEEVLKGGNSVIIVNPRFLIGAELFKE